MPDRITINVLDPDEHRRAYICHRTSDSNLLLLPFDQIESLNYGLKKGSLFLVYDGFNSIERLVERFFDEKCWAPIIAYSNRPEPQRVAEVIVCGAIDYLPEHFTRSDLMDSLTQIKVRASGIQSTHEACHRARAKLTLLTPREQEVTFAVAEGLSNKGMSELLGISPRTVEIHRANALRKLRVKTSLEAARLVFEAKALSTQFPWH